MNSNRYSRFETSDELTGGLEAIAFLPEGMQKSLSSSEAGKVKTVVSPRGPYSIDGKKLQDLAASASALSQDDLMANLKQAHLDSSQGTKVAQFGELGMPEIFNQNNLCVLLAIAAGAGLGYFIANWKS